MREGINSFLGNTLPGVGRSEKTDSFRDWRLLFYYKYTRTYLGQVTDESVAACNLLWRALAWKAQERRVCLRNTGRADALPRFSFSLRISTPSVSVRQPWFRPLGLGHCTACLTTILSRAYHDASPPSIRGTEWANHHQHQVFPPSHTLSVHGCTLVQLRTSNSISLGHGETTRYLHSSLLPQGASANGHRSTTARIACVSDRSLSYRTFILIVATE